MLESPILRGTLGQLKVNLESFLAFPSVIYLYLILPTQVVSYVAE